jgi:hypothetical protein
MIEDGAAPNRGTGPGAAYLHPACLVKVQRSTNVFKRLLLLLVVAVVAGAALFYICVR